MRTGFGGIFQQQASSSSQSQSQPQPQPQLQPQPQPQPPQQVSTSLNSGNNEITNYQTFNSDKYDLGYSESDYPIKDDETPTYCTSKHPRINFFFFASFYFVFIMFGSIVFLIIEQPREIESREKLITLQESFITKYPQVEVEDIKNLLQVLVKAQQDGYFVPIVGSDLIVNEESINPVSKVAKSSALNLSQTNEALVAYEIVNDYGNVTSNRSTLKLQMMKPITNWRFSSSLLFVTSLITTVGYGNLIPFTLTGKISCFIFCIIGVPATLTFFSTLVTISVTGYWTLVKAHVKCVEAWIIRIIMKLHRSASHRLISPVVRIFHLTIIIILLLCICLFLPAHFFNESGWTYLQIMIHFFASNFVTNLFYKCFISEF